MFRLAYRYFLRNLTFFLHTQTTIISSIIKNSNHSYFKHTFISDPKTHTKPNDPILPPNIDQTGDRQ